MNYEWTYILLIGISIAVALTTPLVNPLHSIFLIVGAIITALTFITSAYLGSPITVKQFNVPAFLMQTAICTLVLGIPVFLRPRPAIAITPIILIVGVIAEEVYRIAAFKHVLIAFGLPNLALIMSGIIFAAMHIYWYPAEWLFGIVGGILFTATLMMFKSQTACIASHYLYDALLFGFVSIPIYFLLTAVMGGVGYATRRLQKIED